MKLLEKVAGSLQPHARLLTDLPELLILQEQLHFKINVIRGIPSVFPSSFEHQRPEL